MRSNAIPASSAANESSLTELLRSGGPGADGAFDGLYPAEVQRLSCVHWTPVDVIADVLEALQPRQSTRILDVGSGPGKFCIVGSLLSSGQFDGVEQRRGLYEVATATAERVGAGQARFSLGDALALDWSGYDALYLYNPFEELVFPADRRIDSEVAAGQVNFQRLVRQSRGKLCSMPMGAKVVLFHGLGGPMPSCYRRLSSKRCFDGELAVWQKDRRHPAHRSCC